MLLFHIVIYELMRIILPRCNRGGYTNNLRPFILNFNASMVEERAEVDESLIGAFFP